MAVLYLVSTPIGNLEDVTLRSLRILGEAALVLAEDTRRTRVLLERHGVSASPVSLHTHNEVSRVARVIEALDSGGDVALVSDAGTPLVSDPGERLVAAVLEEGHEVVPIPGASAVLAALTGSGLAAARFTFIGFLPRRAGERDALLRSYAERPETLILFESPKRVAATLRALASGLGDRQACLARELTKLHEEFARGRLSELAERFASGARGEVTLVIEGAPERAREVTDEELDAHIREAQQEAVSSSRELSTRLAAELGVPRRRVYSRILAGAKLEGPAND